MPASPLPVIPGMSSATKALPPLTVGVRRAEGSVTCSSIPVFVERSVFVRGADPGAERAPPQRRDLRDERIAASSERPAAASFARTSADSRVPLPARRSAASLGRAAQRRPRRISVTMLEPRRRTIARRRRWTAGSPLPLSAARNVVTAAESERGFGPLFADAASAVPADDAATSSTARTQQPRRAARERREPVANI